MPLIVLCGQPCSGKSTVAAKLAGLVEQAGHAVSILDEPSLHLERNTSYQNVVNEKNTRAKLKSTVQQTNCKKNVTIVDSLNNIKGYRYELWCIARADGARYCMVHVDTDVATCRAWNTAREGDTYTPEIFDDLAGRFERPDSRNRWDAPLFTVHPGLGDEEESGVLEAVVAAMSAPQLNVAQAVARDLRPTMATSNPALMATNTLHEIDQAAQDVVNIIVDAQAAAAGGAAEIVQFGEGQATLHLTEPVSLAELRRHKRSFLKLATKITFARLQDAASARRMFIDYLRDNLGTQGP